MPSTVKAEARFRVKTKIRPETTISEQFQPNSENVKKDILSQLWNLRGGVMRLPVCRILVLTHNFEVWKPVITRLPLFTICGMWFQRRQWQNCKPKQAVCLELKQKFAPKQQFLNNSNPTLEI